MWVVAPTSPSLDPTTIVSLKEMGEREYRELEQSGTNLFHRGKWVMVGRVGRRNSAMRYMSRLTLKWVENFYGLSVWVKQIKVLE